MRFPPSTGINRWVLSHQEDGNFDCNSTLGHSRWFWTVKQHHIATSYLERMRIDGLSLKLGAIIEV